MTSSGYFDGGTPEIKKEYIPPDYSEESNVDAFPEEDDDDDDDDLDDDYDSDIDEGKEETEQDKILTEDKKVVTGQSNPFSPTTPTTPSWGAPSWGSQGSTPSWGRQGGSSNIWGGDDDGGGGYGQGTTQWGQQGQKIELNREKKVIFCDFLDCIVETWQSNGQPGLVPRDIYDLRIRFDVWDKIRAFDPERVYAIIPKNLISSSSNGAQGWEAALNYYCCCLSAYLKKPFPCCQILSQSVIGQRKEDLIMSALENNRKPIPKEAAVLIGTNSGLYGMSNMDKVAAQICKIDYIDLNELLTLTY